MKELSIEEKAKRYDEAIEIAKEINNEQQAQPFNVMTRVFPELKESEDEKMRRWIINYLDNKALNSGIIQEKTNIKNAIAWLEKQGEQKSADVRTTGYWLVKDTEQKPAWSEEDEKEVAVLEAYIRSKDWSERHVDRALSIVDELVNKVKSLRLQSKQEWSEKDERIIMEIISDLDYCKAIYTDDKYESIDNEINWLKSLKERIGGLTDFDVIGEVVQRNLLEEVVKQMSDALLVETLLYRKKQGTLSIFYDERKEELERFLKSICTWKPSDEQIECLAAAIDESNENAILMSLYQDLKKLKKR